MSRPSRPPPQDPPPARDEKQAVGAYGARINQLFRDALRDLETLKQSLSKQQSK
ncbi:MAG TPA: hypothetical protein VGG66_08035 [Rhizomicrobium sp.]